MNKCKSKNILLEEKDSLVLKNVMQSIQKNKQLTDLCCANLIILNPYNFLYLSIFIFLIKILEEQDLVSQTEWGKKKNMVQPAPNTRGHYLTLPCWMIKMIFNVYQIYFHHIHAF